MFNFIKKLFYKNKSSMRKISLTTTDVTEGVDSLQDMDNELKEIYKKIRFKTEKLSKKDLNILLTRVLHKPELSSDVYSINTEMFNIITFTIDSISIDFDYLENTVLDIKFKLTDSMYENNIVIQVNSSSLYEFLKPVNFES